MRELGWSARHRGELGPREDALKARSEVLVAVEADDEATVQWMLEGDREPRPLPLDVDLNRPPAPSQALL